MKNMWSLLLDLWTVATVVLSQADTAVQRSGRPTVGSVSFVFGISV